jgi:hypothetical protein
MSGRLRTVLMIGLLAAFVPAYATAAVPAYAAAAETPWTLVTPALARPDNLSSAGLFDVAAVSPADVWAVGGGWSDSEQPVIAHWTGADWRPVQAPPVPNFQYNLSAVDVVSARDVWAVGNGMASPSPDFATTPVIAHYDGTAWSLVPTPAPRSSDPDVLTDVDMISATEGWAVGWRGASAPKPLQPLIMRWHNGRWVRVSLSHIGGGNAMLQRVYARAGNDVWAVGSEGDSALVMHFDGVRWRRIGVPRGGVANASNELRAVTVVSPGDVWAAGAACFTRADGIVACQPLVLHLSAGVWRVVPTAGDRGTFLLGVVARASNDVWVVGYDLPQVGQESNYVEHWDGRRFVPVPADAGPLAAQGDPASALEDVTQIPGTTELWAVGWRDGDPQVIRHS